MSLEALTEISCERRNRAFVCGELQGSLQSFFITKDGGLRRLLHRVQKF
jgi:hypothetical protein